MSENKKTIIIIAYISAFLGVCGHASSEFFVKLSGISGVEVSVWRFGIGGLALLILSLINPSSRNLVSPLKQKFLPIVTLSVFGMAFGQFLFHWALDFASVVQVATMVTIMPIGVVFVARVVEGTIITPPKVISGIGAFLGCVFLLTDGYLDQLSGSGNSIIGIYLSIGCALIGSVYLVLVKPYVQDYGPIRMTTYTFVLGFIALYPSIGLIWGIWVNPFDLFDRTSVEYLSIITLGVWNTCIAFILWLWGLSKIPDVARGNYLFFLKPVIALCLAFFVLEDNITINQFIAIIVITGFVLMEIFYSSLSKLFKR
ncbi:DMT family transporter [Pseudomonadota bacterium]|jgi:drug/metabolite transporter (DMT)-like permease|nr:DMT family transporter [Pseudomonadota bacterium]|tara:strand:- start:1189 stop:2130 length:942 start_codon:yes stop_codon:yes gene_type:complete